MSITTSEIRIENEEKSRLQGTESWWKRTRKLFDLCVLPTSLINCRSSKPIHSDWNSHLCLSQSVHFAEMSRGFGRGGRGGRGGVRGGFGGANNPPPMGLTFADLQNLSREATALYPVRCFINSLFVITKLNE